MEVFILRILRNYRILTKYKKIIFLNLIFIISISNIIYTNFFFKPNHAKFLYELETNNSEFFKNNSDRKATFYNFVTEGELFLFDFNDFEPKKSNWFKNNSNQFEVFTYGEINKETEFENIFYLELKLKNGITVFQKFARNSVPRYGKRHSIELAEEVSEFRILIDPKIKSNEYFYYSRPFTTNYHFLETIYLILSSFILISFSILGFGFVFYFKINKGSFYRKIYLIPTAGILFFILFGIFNWFIQLEPVINEINPLKFFFILFLVYIYLSGIQLKICTRLNKSHLKLILIFIFISLIAISRSFISLDLPGVLFKDTISKTLEVGNRSDSRISYHVAQLITLKIPLNTPETDTNFLPYKFNSRGPFVGIISAIFIQLQNHILEIGQPQEIWRPFDSRGFSTYRITAIILAALSIFYIFSFLKKFVSDKLNFVIIFILCSSPFFIHELYFTWPKIISTSFVILSFELVLANSFLLSGIVLSLSYLFHPMSILSFPIFFFWIPIQLSNYNVKNILEYLKNLFKKNTILKFLEFSFGLVIIFLIWLYINNGKLAQSSFLNYFFESDGVPVNLMNWLKGRTNSTLNSFIPFFGVFFDKYNRSTNSIFDFSSDVVRVNFMYWCNFTAGIGLVNFFIFLRFLKIKNYIFTVFILLPTIFLLIYWGNSTSGILRESGHVIFLSLYIALGLSLKEQNIKTLNFILLILILRMIELVSYLILPVLMLDSITEIYQLNDYTFFAILTLSVFSLAYLETRNISN